MKYIPLAHRMPHITHNMYIIIYLQWVKHWINAHATFNIVFYTDMSCFSCFHTNPQQQTKSLMGPCTLESQYRRRLTVGGGRARCPFFVPIRLAPPMHPPPPPPRDLGLRTPSTRCGWRLISHIPAEYIPPMAVGGMQTDGYCVLTSHPLEGRDCVCVCGGGGLIDAGGAPPPYRPIRGPVDAMQSKG